MSRTSAYPWIDRALNGKLEEILRTKREAGESFEDIARDLAADHEVDVSSSTVRRWIDVLDPPVHLPEVARPEPPDRRPAYETDPSMGLVE